MKIHEEKEQQMKTATLENIAKTEEPKYEKKMTYNDETRSYECNICNETFNKIPLLTQHMLKHSGSEPYACSICNAQYNDLTLLNTHMKTIHENIPLYEKIDLPKTERTDLGRKHSRLYSYECHVCGLIFNKIPQLTQHMSSHTGQDPYQCSLCNIKYKDISMLRAHMKICDKTHTCLPEMNFSSRCVYCNKNFNDPVDFAKHLKMHRSKNENIKIEVESDD